MSRNLGELLSHKQKKWRGKVQKWAKKRGDKERQRPQNIICKRPWSFWGGGSAIKGDAELMGVEYRKRGFSYLFDGGDVSMTVLKKSWYCNYTKEPSDI